MTGEYEVDNPVVKATLRDIAAKIGSALPAGWGFLLHIFSFGDKGSTFYISNAERADAIAMLREWIEKQNVDEINPEHPLVKQAHDHWHKIAALLLLKISAGDPARHHVVTSEDVAALGRLDCAIAMKDEPDGLHLFIVDTKEARRLAAEGKAVEGRTL
jgi:hypothetical protein